MLFKEKQKNQYILKNIEWNASKEQKTIIRNHRYYGVYLKCLFPSQ